MNSHQYCIRVPSSPDPHIYIYWGLHCPTCRILVPRPGIKPAPPAVEAWSPNHWTTREFHIYIYIYFFFFNIFIGV